jgi:hypothetical protein
VNLVLFIQDHDPGGESFDLILRENGISHDDEPVAGLGPPGGGAVHADRPRPPFLDDEISREPLAVRDIEDFDAFERLQSGRLHQVFVDTQAAFVIQVGLRYGRPVDLGMEKSF